MIIKIGAFEIRTGNDARRDEPQAISHVAATESGTGVSEVVYDTPRQQSAVVPPPRVGKSNTGLALCAEKAHPITSAIDWPVIPEDPMSQTRLSILINTTDEAFRKYQNVDICVLRNYIDKEGIVLYGTAREAFEHLRELHCIDFQQIHPTVIQTIPELYSTVFRAMRGEFDINDAWVMPRT